MESDYNKKDLKSSPKVKVVEEGIIKKDGKLYKFIWIGYEDGFEKEEHAKKALERMKSE